MLSKYLTFPKLHDLGKEVIRVSIETSCCADLFIHFAICDKLLHQEKAKDSDTPKENDYIVRQYHVSVHVTATIIVWKGSLCLYPSRQGTTMHAPCMCCIALLA